MYHTISMRICVLISEEVVTLVFIFFMFAFSILCNASVDITLKTEMMLTNSRTIINQIEEWNLTFSVKIWYINPWSYIWFHIIKYFISFQWPKTSLPLFIVSLPPLPPTEYSVNLKGKQRSWREQNWASVH